MFPRSPQPSSLESSSFGFTGASASDDERGTPTHAHPSPGPIVLHNLATLLQREASVMALTNGFPGPLSLGLYTSRAEVVSFCETQASSAGLGSAASILWQLLSLRVRHGGMHRSQGAAPGDNMVCR